MLNENIVSLLIPCYNGEQFVERCLINGKRLNLG